MCIKYLNYYLIPLRTNKINAEYKGLYSSQILFGIEVTY